MSAPRIRPAHDPDRPAICRFLHDNMSDKFTLAEWDRLFAYRWLREKPDLGRILEDRGEIIGFMGNIYSVRIINDRPEWIVSLSAWYLHKAYRKQGLGRDLMASATENPDMTYTLLNSSARTLHLLPDLGFTVMDDTRYYWTQSGTRQLDVTVPGVTVPGVTVINDWDAVYAGAGERERGYLQDHRALPVRSFLLRVGSRTCLLMCSIVTKKDGRLYYDALYIGDPQLLARNAQAIADALLPDANSVLAVDARFLTNARLDDHARAVTLSVPLSFKTTRLRADQVDNLYTEIQLMNLKLR